MSRNLPIEIPMSEAKKIESLLDELLAEMRKARKQMEKDQDEIDRLHISTQAKLDKLKRDLRVS
jgi:hypothetical protein